MAHYHADNGAFVSELWSIHLISKGQGLTFVEVGAHHQNGKAESKIRYFNPEHNQFSFTHGLWLKCSSNGSDERKVKEIQPAAGAGVSGLWTGIYRATSEFTRVDALMIKQAWIYFISKLYCLK